MSPFRNAARCPAPDADFRAPIARIVHGSPIGGDPGTHA
jgi:hypothetical protein